MFEWVLNTPLSPVQNTQWLTTSTGETLEVITLKFELPKDALINLSGGSSDALAYKVSYKQLKYQGSPLRCSLQKLPWKISLNSQETTYASVSFLILL